VATLPAPELISNARTPRDYRQDGARHIYSKNSNRIFKGQLPPLMHAVGVLQIDVDGRGNVRGLNWMRAPSHVPDVMREIERTVREAAPFPAPVQLGSVTYTDTWLWDRSGNFQLDTLTEGQRLR
jgi:periplasmic protein TonB